MTLSSVCMWVILCFSFSNTNRISMYYLLRDMYCCCFSSKAGHGTLSIRTSAVVVPMILLLLPEDDEEEVFVDDEDDNEEDWSEEEEEDDDLEEEWRTAGGPFKSSREGLESMLGFLLLSNRPRESHRLTNTSRDQRKRRIRGIDKVMRKWKTSVKSSLFRVLFTLFIQSIASLLNLSLAFHIFIPLLINCSFVSLALPGLCEKDRKTYESITRRQQHEKDMFLLFYLMQYP